MTDSINSNISLLQKIDIRNLDSCADIFADNFVFHYYNPKLTELEGDYRGLEELKSFFEKLAEISNYSFNVSVIDTRPVGDELVVIQARNRISIEGKTMEFDVVVVWRFVEGKISEAWDIPSVFHTRLI